MEFTITIHEDRLKNKFVATTPEGVFLCQDLETALNVIKWEYEELSNKN